MVPTIRAVFTLEGGKKVVQYEGHDTSVRPLDVQSLDDVQPGDLVWALERVDSIERRTVTGGSPPETMPDPHEAGQ